MAAKSHNTLGRALQKCLSAYYGCFMVYVNTHMMRDKLARFGPVMRGKLLDVGAGTKPYREFFSHVDNYIGANALPYYLPAIPADIGKSTDIWISDALPLPFADGSFDCLSSFQVLSVIEDPGAFFAELRRLVKPGGDILLSTDFLYPKWAEGDCFRHTDHSLRSLALRSGFDVVAVESFGGWMTTVHCLLMRYIRDYPSRIRRAASRGLKLWRSLLFLGWLAALPALAATGWLILLADRRHTDDSAFTMNFLIAMKRRLDPGCTDFSA